MPGRMGESVRRTSHRRGNMVIFRGLIAAGSALIALSSGESRADDWEAYQHDVQHTGRSSANIDPGSLQLAWQAPAGYSVPLVVGDIVYSLQNGQGTGTPSQIASFRLGDGAMNWLTSGLYDFPTQLSYANGLLVYSAHDPATFKTNLYVLDATTGHTDYTLPLGGNLITVAPATAPGGHPVAYLSELTGMAAVQLGQTSGQLLWSQVAQSGAGTASAPSLIGQSVLLAGPDQYYAFDRTTGAVNHFHVGLIQGGGGDTPVVDSARSQFYILDAFNGPTTTLTAYHYTDNSHITQIWQRTGAGIGNGNQVALGSDGKIYTAGGDTLLELDPVDGHTIRSLAGQNFAAGTAPLISNGYLWDYSESQTVVYNLTTFTPQYHFPGSRGSLNTAYVGIGALENTHFLQDFGNIYGNPGFTVYAAAPEPSVTSVFLAIGAVIAFRRQRKALVV